MCSHFQLTDSSQLILCFSFSYVFLLLLLYSLQICCCCCTNSKNTHRAESGEKKSSVRVFGSTFTSDCDVDESSRYVPHPFNFKNSLTFLMCARCCFCCSMWSATTVACLQSCFCAQYSVCSPFFLFHQKEFIGGMGPLSLVSFFPSSPTHSLSTVVHIDAFVRAMPRMRINIILVPSHV